MILHPFDAALVPHPFEPIIAEPQSLSPPQQRSLERQRARRAEILADTRRLLAETGHERLTLRRVAERCGVTVQTIRNSFGRREDLIAQAVNEHTTTIWRRLGQPYAGPQAFIAFPDVIRHVVTQAPAFLRGTICAAFTNIPSLQVLQSHAALNKTQLLRQMARRDLIRPEIDIGMLADQITKIDTMLMYEWSQTGDDKALFDQMANAHKVLLLGALRPAVAAQLES
jgi:AcrR family transcriptional regulator